MRIYLTTGLIFFIVLSLPASGQDFRSDSSLTVADTLQNDFGIFDNDGLLHLSLRFDVQEYIKKRPRDQYMDALLTYHINDKDSINKKIKLKSRGEFRHGYCAFPPLSISLIIADSGNTKQVKTEKIKVVTHCQYGNENYLFKEYLVYRLYNLLTEFSFRVRLAKIEYISTAKKSKIISSYCFLVEPFDLLTERTNTVEVNSASLIQRNMIPEMMNRVTIFNYMVGNTDWAVTYQHNCKTVKRNSSDDQGLGIPVPFDFDYSGLVNAHYATPAENLGLESVLQRRYLGLCRTEKEFSEALKEFSAKKNDFYLLISEFPYLNEKERKLMIDYLDEFYSLIDNANTIIKNFESECSDF